MTTFSHDVFYVKNVLKAIDFYESVFDFKPKYIHESNEYAEIDIGKGIMAFASTGVPKECVKYDMECRPGSVVVFTVSDVQKFYEKAIRKGAVGLVPPKQAPWG